MTARPVIAVVAGEASGDQLGAALIRALSRLRPQLRFVGVAGPAMREAGCESWFDSEELAVMGLAEVLRHLPRIARLKSRLTSRLLDLRPAAYVGIDAPDFNLRVAPVLRRAGLRTIQYVCPSVWAWRSGRVKTLREACDHVLCLLPFEQPFLAAAGVPATFVGHPFADQIDQVADPAPARCALGLGAGPVVGLLPGSRVGEVTRLGGDLIAAGALLRTRRESLELVAPMASPNVRRLFESQCRSSAVPVRLVDGRAREVIAASDVVITASGTATLETMLVGRPMVVAYRFAPLTYAVARAFSLVSARHFALPNLLADAPLVPELLQSQVTPERLAAEANAFFDNPSRVSALRTRFSKLHEELRRDASARAADAVRAVANID